MISSPSGGPSAISAGFTIIGIASHSRGCRLYIFYLMAEVCSCSFPVKGAGFPLACRYHLWILLHDSLVFHDAISESIPFPVVLTLRLLLSLSAVCNLVFVVLSSSWYSGCIRLRDMLWSANVQVASEIHVATYCFGRIGFLTYVQIYSNSTYSYHIGTLFGASMGQVVLPL